MEKGVDNLLGMRRRDLLYVVSSFYERDLVCIFNSMRSLWPFQYGVYIRSNDEHFFLEHLHMRLAARRGHWFQYARVLVKYDVETFSFIATNHSVLGKKDFVI